MHAAANPDSRYSWQEVADLQKRVGGGRTLLTDLTPAAGGRPPGQTPLLHFIYKSPTRGQYVAPAWTCPLDDVEFRLVSP